MDAPNRDRRVMTISRPKPPETGPFWMVQAVFDPDGDGADFAYTMGLADRGFPELHVYARPTEGDDPGADWKFSPQDCMRLLNDLAAMLVRGELGVGSTLRREYDGGLAVVDYRVDPPGDREQLEAFGAPPGADVLPVRWSLSRPPVGAAVLLSAKSRQRARERYDALVERLEPGLWVPSGWELPAEPSFEVDQGFGPMTPLVLARAAHMSQVGAMALSGFLRVSGEVDHALDLTWPVTRARAMGRSAGRSASVDALVPAVQQLLDTWADNLHHRRRWTAVVDYFSRDWPPEVPTPSRQRLSRNLRELLSRSIFGCLAGEVVFDLADEELTLWAAGPWQAATAADGRPGPEWYASDLVLDRVRSILGDLAMPDLLKVAALHHRAMTEPGSSAELERYVDLKMLLSSAAVTSAASCPPMSELLSEPGTALLLRVQFAAAASGQGHDCFACLDEWLECLTSLLVHRARLSNDAVDAFARAVEAVLPGLGAALNQPI